MLARILPFALYLLFLALAQGLAWLTHNVAAFSGLTTTVELWLYPVKTLVVLGALLYFWPCFDELKDHAISAREITLATAVGILVYFMWVHADWPWAMVGSPGTELEFAL